MDCNINIPDKSWMNIDNRFDKEYIRGVEKFLEWALANNKRLAPGYIPCPCKKCRNKDILTSAVVYEHLIINGFMSDYQFWYRHGEVSYNSSLCRGTTSETSKDNMNEMLTDAFGMRSIDDDYVEEDATRAEHMVDDARSFFKLMEEA